MSPSSPFSIPFIVLISKKKVLKEHGIDGGLNYNRLKTIRIKYIIFETKRINRLVLLNYKLYI